MENNVIQELLLSLDVSDALLPMDIPALVSLRNAPRTEVVEAEEELVLLLMDLPV